MKKSSILLIIILTLFLTTGCNKKSITISNEKVNTNNMEHKHCTRAASQEEGMTTNLEYDIYYTNDILNVLESTEKVISNNSETLDEYEKAYNNINSYYTDLKYYDSKVERTDNSVSRRTSINYDKIDIDELISIEGADDNIVENGQAKVKLWLDLAKKFGAKCEVVDE